MRLPLIPTFAAALAAATLFGGAAHAAPLKAAVFNFELVDSSQEGEMDGVRADQTRRLDETTSQVRDALKAAGVELVDPSGANEQLKDVKALHDCLKCAQKAAQTVGADLAVIGHVQKVSNLILNINVQIVDARSGRTVRGGSADIRGNTEESWTRGTKYLMKNTILKQPLKADGAP
jgi:hypothetical protein